MNMAWDERKYLWRAELFAEFRQRPQLVTTSGY
jgi:hypothetical protein